LLIVLMGFMGAGKTTIGYLLAEKLGLPFVDVDILIEHRTRRRVVDIFAEDGEAAFRRMEHETIVETLSGPAAVVALGGGAVEHPGTRQALDSVTGVHLEVSYEEALLRIGRDDLRPMMQRPDIGEIYRRRLPVYHGAAKLAVRTDGRRPEDIVLGLLELLVAPRSVPPGSRSVLVAPMGGAHQVHIGAGIATDLAALLPRATSVGCASWYPSEGTGHPLTRWWPVCATTAPNLPRSTWGWRVRPTASPPSNGSRSGWPSAKQAGTTCWSGSGTSTLATSPGSSPPRTTGACP